MINPMGEQDALKASAKGISQDAVKKLGQFVAAPLDIKNHKVLGAVLALPHQTRHEGTLKNMIERSFVNFKNKGRRYKFGLNCI
jgi:hypothetical protein